MSVFEGLMFAIAFSSLILAILSFDRKKQSALEPTSEERIIANLLIAFKAILLLRPFDVTSIIRSFLMYLYPHLL
ncbi:hypothetical protein MUB24_14370 [Lederbergia sp. NSJ-179]|uniref:hypothetical protein n=1 Tax=Lederbergia sp. NSJ-179 TaxID=2931402 RepID=UPI001FD5CB36|nr:hypothetical protein [Lederbergia sp. NSJ-179]MCJ7842066.1 hypothetical protein [Lederbergia sp. NSJ-179]